MKKTIKEYQVVINRVYTTYIELKFPDDGRDHIQEVDERLANRTGMLWDLIYEKELEQMNITDESWEISEKESIESHWEFDENGNNIIK